MSFLRPEMAETNPPEEREYPQFPSCPLDTLTGSRLLTISSRLWVGATGAAFSFILMEKIKILAIAFIG